MTHSRRPPIEDPARDEIGRPLGHLAVKRERAMTPAPAWVALEHQIERRATEILATWNDGDACDDWEAVAHHLAERVATLELKLQGALPR
jgi:hypothetical protein